MRVVVPVGIELEAQNVVGPAELHEGWGDEGEHLAVEGLHPRPWRNEKCSAAPARRGPSMVVGNQAARSASSVRARQTALRGWASRRSYRRIETSPARSSDAELGRIAHAHDLPLLGFHDFEMALERVEVARPLPAVGRQPLVDLAQRLGADPVDPALGVRAGLRPGRPPAGP